MAAITDSGIASGEVKIGGTPPGGIRFLAGFSVQELGGATGTVTYYDGTDVTGRPLLSANLLANDSFGESFASWKVVTSGHVYVAITGNVRWYADVIE